MIDIQKSIESMLKQLPEDISVLLENETNQAFASESWEGTKWSPRKDKLNNRALLIGSGALKRSITFEHTPNSVSVSTDLKYAKIQNEGGKIVQKPTFKQRMFFSYKSNNASSTKDANKWAAMSTAKELKITIPARQFIGISDSFFKKLEIHLDNEINKIL